MYIVRFDMRAPAIGATPSELYAAAPDMCAWAEGHGCLGAVLCEHHGSDDGYLPAPIILGAAVAARTKRLAVSLILILAFYDPVRLAEDMAVSTSAPEAASMKSSIYCADYWRVRSISRAGTSTSHRARTPQAGRC